MGKFRPNLEILDARDVPAVLLWTDASGDNQFDTAANWSLGDGSNRVPQAGDDLVFQANPSSGGGVGVDGGGGISPPVSYPSYGMHAPDGGGDYNSVTLDASYTETVTVTGAFGTGDFVLQGGTIDQPSPTSPNVSTDITVTGAETAITPDGAPTSFFWNGGTLNSTNSDAADYLNGGTAIIDPRSGTLATGDSLNYLNATTGTIKFGTLNFLNGSPLTIDGGSKVSVETAADKGQANFDGPAASYTDGKAKIELKNEGSLTVFGGGPWSSNNRTIVNNGGLLEIKDAGTTASFGAVAAPPAGTPIVTDILQNTGTIKIHSSTTLTSSFGAMEVKAGSLLAVADGGVGARTSTIGCQLTVSGGTIRVTTNYGILFVKKDIYWMGGTFQAAVDYTDDKNDEFQTNEKLYVGGTATLSIVPFNVPANGLAVNFLRRMVYAAQGIANVVPNMAPSLTLQNAAGGPAVKLNLITNAFPANSMEYDLN